MTLFRQSKRGWEGAFESVFVDGVAGSPLSIGWLYGFRAQVASDCISGDAQPFVVLRALRWRAIEHRTEADARHTENATQQAQRLGHPFYGSQRMVVFLRNGGHVVNRKHVQRLMRSMGLAAMAPGPNTSKAHPQHKVYPYLLRGVQVTRPNQVWSTDITGGGALIVDRYGDDGETPQEKSNTGQRRAADEVEMGTA
jgi:hypothetical protein